MVLIAMFYNKNLHVCIIAFTYDELWDYVKTIDF